MASKPPLKILTTYTDIPTGCRVIIQQTGADTDTPVYTGSVTNESGTQTRLSSQQAEAIDNEMGGLFNSEAIGAEPKSNGAGLANIVGDGVKGTLSRKVIYSHGQQESAPLDILAPPNNPISRLCNARAPKLS